LLHVLTFHCLSIPKSIKSQHSIPIHYHFHSTPPHPPSLYSPIHRLTPADRLPCSECDFLLILTQPLLRSISPPPSRFSINLASVFSHSLLSPTSKTQSNCLLFSSESVKAPYQLFCYSIFSTCASATYTTSPKALCLIHLYNEWTKWSNTHNPSTPTVPNSQPNNLYPTPSGS
jgi:hypothetical protein